MLTRLFISNYILIDELEMDFSEGLSIITGETGAGKSIIVGALSLITGQKSDSKVILNTDKKCVLEASFNLNGYNLEPLFETEAIDYDNHTIIRREILPNGKSRAFINDTPTNLATLKKIGERLIDIHSQHETLLLNKADFQLSIIDNIAKSQLELEGYKTAYKEYQSLSKELDLLRSNQKQQKLDQDYYTFLFNELHAANLKPNEQIDLESEQQILANAEQILASLTESEHLLSTDEAGILIRLKRAIQALQPIQHLNGAYQEIANRLNSTYIELNDITSEIQNLTEKGEFNPTRLVFINERLDVIYTLQQKHQVDSVSDLITIYNQIDEKLKNLDSLDEKIIWTEKQLSITLQHLQQKGNKLTEKRKESFNIIEEQLKDSFTQLGMPDAIIKIQYTPKTEPDINGFDTIRFLFTANKGYQLQTIENSASGGELSRIMLSVKSLISNTSDLPTVIFDEIDAGISGDIAHKAGLILKTMSKSIQVWAITHQPLIAAKADHHYFVYKDSTKETTISKIRKLSISEREEEIAKMISGEKTTETALKQARELLM